MAHPRRFRFGVQAAGAPDAEAWRRIARKAEDLGYSTLFIPDHFGDQLAPVPALMAAADATTTLRVGGLVLDNDYRHPVVLAKELATLDVLSGGRLEVGLGAGWMRTDYDQSGIGYDPPKVRVDRFEEGLAVVKGLLGSGGEPFSFAGDHYQVTDMPGLPRPVQQPVPVLIGGGGRRVLSIAAREADIVGINPNLRSGAVDKETIADATAASFDQKVAWVREAAGSRFDDIELNLLVFVAVVTDDRQAMAEMLAGGFGVDPQDALSIPNAFVGTVNEICDDLVERRERWGVSYVVFQEGAMDAMAPVVARLAGT
jgi:probable F420-dependent oxidoreductase